MIIRFGLRGSAILAVQRGVSKSVQVLFSWYRSSSGIDSENSETASISQAGSEAGGCAWAA